MYRLYLSMRAWEAWPIPPGPAGETFVGAVRGGHLFPPHARFGTAVLFEGSWRPIMVCIMRGFTDQFRERRKSGPGASRTVPEVLHDSVCIMRTLEATIRIDSRGGAGALERAGKKRSRTNAISWPVFK